MNRKSRTLAWLNRSNTSLSGLALFYLALGVRLLLCAFLPAQPSIDLEPFENRVFSQNGEDGVLRQLFAVIGTTNNYFVEFGVEGGQECNTRYLREHEGWHGLMMDGFHEEPAINLQRAFITADNINALLTRYQVPRSFDLLSIDIDYNDFYVWQAIKDYRPRVVVIEYNATHLPTEDKVVRPDPGYMWDTTNYYGASMLALYRLGRLKGYTLIYAEKNGVNLFFVKDEIARRHRFKNAGNVELLYRFPQYGTGPNGGHQPDPLNRPYLSSREALHWRQDKD